MYSTRWCPRDSTSRVGVVPAVSPTSEPRSRINWKEKEPDDPSPVTVMIRDSPLPHIYPVTESNIFLYLQLFLSFSFILILPLDYASSPSFTIGYASEFSCTQTCSRRITAGPRPESSVKEIMQCVRGPFHLDAVYSGCRSH